MYLSIDYLTAPSSASSTWTAILFGLTYVALAVGRIPGLRTDRAGIAVIGAAAMLGTGVIGLEAAAKGVDVETIVLLFGMMVVVAHLRMSGFFALATDRISRRFAGPKTLLGVTIALSGVLSAFLVNDVVCVALTPLILQLCRKLNRPPIPYLIGIATASNVGSTATITGNPQNIIIGSLSHISYLRFAARLAPIAIVGLLINYAIVAFVYRRTLAAPVVTEIGSKPTCARIKLHRKLLIKSSSVTLIAIALFFTGLPIAIIALAAAGFLMLDRINPDKVYSTIDWPLLIMFMGLFVVVKAFDLHVVHTWGVERWTFLRRSPVAMVSGLSLILSNLVSNVPAVLLFEPLMKTLPDPEQGWLALAASSTLAGNLTVLGSVANLIVVETARREGAELSFVEYLKVGVPLTLVTSLIATAWLGFTRY